MEKFKQLRYVSHIFGLLFIIQILSAQGKGDNNDYQYALIEAVKQKNLGNFPDAIKLYKLVIKDKTDCAIAHYELGTIYLMSNQLGTAEMYLRNAYELDPSNYWYRGGYIDILIANKKYKEAETLLKSICKENPQEAEYTFMLARLYLIAEKPKKALKLLNKIEKIYGVSEKVTLLKASVYESIGKYELAKEEIDKVLDFFPESLQFRIVAAELCMKNDEEDKAAEYYIQVFEIDSTNVFALTNLTDYYRNKENYERSFYYLTRSFSSDQIDQKRKLAILSFYTSEEENIINYSDELKKLVEVYLENFPNDTEGKLIAVDFYINIQDYSSAYYLLEQYLSMAEAPYGLWLQAVLLANASGLNENLVDITGRAIDNFADSADIYFFRSIGLYGLEKYEEVIGSLESIKFENYSNEEYMRQSYNLLAECYNQIEDYEKADELYEIIIEENPTDFIAMNNYSYYLAERGVMLEKAKSMSFVTISENPDNATFIDTYAWVLYKLNDLKNAEIYINQALNKGGDNDPDVNEHAGDIQFALGNFPMAKSYYDKAIILGGDKDRLTGKTKKAGDKE